MGGQNGEWNGDWGDGSHKWAERPDVIQALRGLVPIPYADKNDGVFFMEFQDFMKYMGRLNFAGPVETFGGHGQRGGAIKYHSTPNDGRDGYEYDGHKAKSYELGI